MFDLNDFPIEEFDLNEEQFDETEIQLDFMQIEVGENQIEGDENSVGLTSQGSTSCILNEGCTTVTTNEHLSGSLLSETRGTLEEMFELYKQHVSLVGFSI
ncbi:uncharacterized protein LOC130812511 [Amaranthus tricolor]|uniref:uncharacterized protein LOC130812511 n=1 Tax=Amaranthus tricolor TaxID=29722 RepID=UPI002586CAE5|nr:uncharacterized protein LOC130812511 [Amaranthus tricolor]